jgi:hypothetical protein
MTETPAQPPAADKVHIRRVYVVIAALLAGLALAPGYLLLCGHSSGRQVARYDLYNAAADGNTPRPLSVTVPLSPDMNPVGLNVIIATPFRQHNKAESATFIATLYRDKAMVWDANFFLGHGHKVEAVAGTTFTVRAGSFKAPAADNYAFTLVTQPDFDNIRSISLEVRRNVMLPRPWIVGLGILIIVCVMVWAMIPPKGYDMKAERVGTKWYE